MRTTILAALLALAACAGPDDPTPAPPVNPDPCAPTCAALSELWGCEVFGGQCGTYPDGVPLCVCVSANDPAASDPCSIVRPPPP